MDDFPSFNDLIDDDVQGAKDNVSALEQERGFTTEELQIAEKVLKCLSEKQHLLENPEYRGLRTTILPLISPLGQRFYEGKNLDEYINTKGAKRDLNRRKMQERMLDEKYKNSCQLRKERLMRLEELEKQGPMGDEENGLRLLYVPDGVAKDATTGMDTVSSNKLLRLDHPDLTDGMDGKPDSATGNGIEDSVNDDGPEFVDLHGPKSCYSCKKRYYKLHFFYDQMCPECAVFNYQKRKQSTSLEGKVALVTGARVKIGFQVTLKLLEAGARVIATSRFPRDASERFSRHPRFGVWSHRLQVFGLDFRHPPSVERFTLYVCTHYERLDIIVNNACQTVRRPPAYYKHLLATENETPSNEATRMLMMHHTEFATASHLALPAAGTTHTTHTDQHAHAQAQAQAQAQVHAQETQVQSQQGSDIVTPLPEYVPSTLMSQLCVVTGDDEHSAQQFPTGLYDVNGQQIDLRTKHSWLLKLGEIDSGEVAEVFAVNALTPFILNGKLRPLMEKTGPSEPKFIVNVSAMEGKFYRYKTPFHPHTNMAKAALNMMTATCADDYAQSGIYMNSVDTGWINDENPLEKAHRIAQQGFQTPIDEVDAAARILDPVFYGMISGTFERGKFFKDYFPTEW